jgi:hypothetical protein
MWKHQVQKYKQSALARPKYRESAHGTPKNRESALGRPAHLKPLKFLRQYPPFYVWKVDELANQACLPLAQGYVQLVVSLHSLVRTHISKRRETEN